MVCSIMVPSTLGSMPTGNDCPAYVPTFRPLHTNDGAAPYLYSSIFFVFRFHTATSAVLNRMPLYCKDNTVFIIFRLSRTPSPPDNNVFNSCISVNARNGLAGRHGKNVTVNGGHYNRIDDHYGKNYVIRDVVFDAWSTWVMGYRTPQCDPNKLIRVPSTAKFIIRAIYSATAPMSVISAVKSYCAI